VSRSVRIVGISIVLAVVAVLCAAALRPVGVIAIPVPLVARVTPTPAPVRLAFLGDSYSAGVGATGTNRASDATAGYAGITARALGPGDTYAVFAQGGTGYLNPGQAVQSETAYSGRVKSVIAWKPDVLVVQGGGNDVGSTEAAFRTAVRSTLQALRDGLPAAKVFCLGPVAGPSSDAKLIARINRDLAQETKAVGVTFIDPSGWLSTGDFISDGFHPNRGGHQKIADRLTGQLRTAVGASMVP
jgi:acyl-CoA thioesterase-1